MSLFSRAKDSVLLKFKSANLQNTAQEYWSKCENSFIGADELYVNQEKIILNHFAPNLNTSDEIIDIGCCDGRFSLLISQMCKRIDAFDLSEAMIEKAIAQAKGNNIDNINFWSQNIDDLSIEKNMTT